MFDLYNCKTIVKPQYRKLVADYLLYWKKGWQHFSNPRISSSLRLQKLALLERAIRKDCPLPDHLLTRLQKSFLQENLSLSLLIEPLTAWRYLALDRVPSSEKQATEILQTALTPLARLLMALDDENPSTYLPMTSLLLIFVLLSMFVHQDNFLLKAKFYKRQKDSKLKGLFKNARVILPVLKSHRLKFKLAVMLNTAQIFIRRFQNNEQLHLAFLDYFRIILYSLIQFFFIKRKTITKQGI